MGKIERAIGKNTANIAQIEWSCLLCLSCQLCNLYVPLLSQTGMKLRGKDIGQPLEAKPKKK